MTIDELVGMLCKGDTPDFTAEVALLCVRAVERAVDQHGPEILGPNRRGENYLRAIVCYNMASMCLGHSASYLQAVAAALAEEQAEEAPSYQLKGGDNVTVH